MEFLETVCFSSVQVGGKRIRVIYLRQRDTDQGPCFITRRLREDDIPLFLGADVLAGSSVLTKNHGRIHARFSKENVATKVTLSGAQMEGINHCTQLWFYNIQGLFRVTFEYLQEQAQRDCLVHLKDLWLEMLPYSQLPQDMCLAYCREEDKSQSDQQLFMTEYIVPCEESNESQVLSFQTGSLMETISAEHLVELPIGNEVFDKTEGSENLDLSFALEPNAEGSSPPIFITEQILNVEVERTLSKSKALNPTEFPNKDKMSLNEICHYVVSLIQELGIKLSDKERTLLENLEVLIEYFRTDFIDNAQCKAGLPIDIFEQYNRMVNDKSACSLDSRVFNIPERESIGLNLICEWLGKKLHGFTEQISEKVETFKVKHLETINSLPCPQVIIDTLFPPCMKILMVNWMGQQADDCSGSLRDHDYSPPTKKPSTPKDKHFINSFAFVQLILEFANNVLISGVAHVLYSRLLHDGTC